VHAVVGVARAVEVAVPLVLGEALLEPDSISMGSVVSASTCSKKSM
jgi:hypothetical protein